MRFNGCHSREPFKETMPVQDGWVSSANGTTRIPRMIPSPFRMEADCQYSKFDQYNDPQCTDCKWKFKEANDVA